jgi:hypothetical protein
MSRAAERMDGVDGNVSLGRRVNGVKVLCARLPLSPIASGQSLVAG